MTRDERDERISKLLFDQKKKTGDLELLRHEARTTGELLIAMGHVIRDTPERFWSGRASAHHDFDLGLMKQFEEDDAKRALDYATAVELANRIRHATTELQRLSRTLDLV